MNLYVIRHGQSQSNAAHVYGGWHPYKLTEQGRADALIAARVLKGIDFEKVYSSDLIRAMETCEIALGNLPYETDPRLREISVGKIAGLSLDQAIEKYGPHPSLVRRDRDFSAFEGESTPMQMQRIAEFMAHMEKSGYTGNVAVFCHEGSIRCMLSYVLGIDHIAPASVSNGAVGCFSWNGEKWLLKQWNIT